MTDMSEGTSGTHARPSLIDAVLACSERAAHGWWISPEQRSWMESLVRRAEGYARGLEQAGDAA